jgi:integrase
MAHVQRRTRGGQVRWIARVPTPDGRERTRTFDRKADAQRWVTDQEASKARGQWVDPTLGRQTFATYVSDWLPSIQGRAPTTQQNIRGRLSNHLLPFFGEMRIASIRPSHVRAWVVEMQSKRLAPATIRSTYGTLSKILRAAEVDQVIGRSPCVGIDLPRDTGREEMRFLSPEEVARLAEEIAPRYRALIYTAAYTGMRWRELAAVRVDRTNLLRGTVDVVEAISEAGGRLYEGSTKTGRPRTVSLPRFLAEMLGEHIGRYHSAEDRVFSSAQGLTLRRRNFYRRHYKPAVAAAGINPDLRFHDLRHTCAALLIAQGAHAKEIQERLGHSTIRVTFDRYGHLLPSLDERLRDGLEATYRAAEAALGGS